jgi:hypothetical protein
VSILPSSAEATDEGLRPLVTGVAGGCYILDCGRDRLYELIRSGVIESYLEGRARKVVIASLYAYVANRRTASKQFKRARYLRNAAEP